MRYFLMVALVLIAGCQDAASPVAPVCHGGDDICQAHYAVLYTADTAKVRTFGDTLPHYKWHGPIFRVRDGKTVLSYQVVWSVCTPLC